jgi:hypothetical protein
MPRRKKPKREIPLTTFRDDVTGIELAVHSNDRPTPEALRHDEFATGWNVGREIGTGFRRVDSLTAMASRGTITADMLTAGLRFRALFDRAALHGVAAGALDPIPRGTDRSRMQMGEAVAFARERIAADIELLGSHGAPMADACWYIVGLGENVEQYALRARWAGKALNPKMVTGLVIGALSLLDAKRHGRPT